MVRFCQVLGVVLGVVLVLEGSQKIGVASLNMLLEVLPHVHQQLGI